MENALDHNKLLKSIARNRFNPIGIIQKGQSRTFLKDNHWHTIIIEFQPSSWSKGTYLNIGVDCHFFPQEHLAFSYAHRESAFEEFENEEQFTELISELCELAVKRVELLDVEFANPSTAITTLESRYRDSGWKKYDLAVLYAWTGLKDRSISIFKELLSEPAEQDWQKERNEKAEEILGWVIDGDKLEAKLRGLIEKVRAMKMLPEKASR